MARTFPTFTMQRISRPLDTAPDQVWDYIIVGSGYGGSIAASRLARANLNVLVLERGDEILPGEYPSDLQGAQGEVDVITARDGVLPKNRLTPAAKARPGGGMMQLRLNDDVHVILGNGLGGGSLVNAGVSIQPDLRVFDEGWPGAYKPVEIPGQPGQRTNTLSPHFEKVAKQLGATVVPEELQPPKMKSLRKSADRMKQPFAPAEINVTFERGENFFGFTQAACTMCGDCCSGCNYGAKNTLIMNYLPDAYRHGAFIATRAEVDTVLQDDSVPGEDRFVVHLRRKDGEPPAKPLMAKGVILAAGSLGSTEILMRSNRAGLRLAADQLGKKFSTNGDVLGFGFGANLPGSAAGESLPGTPLYSIGAGSNPPDRPEYRPGPTITGIIKVNMDPASPLKDGLVIEDGTAPGPLAAIYPPAMFLQEAVTANLGAYPDATRRMKAVATLAEDMLTSSDPSALSYKGIMAQMQAYLVMSHDDSSGRLVLGEHDLASVVYPNAGSKAPYPQDNEKLKEAAAAIWADYIANPIWQPGFGNNVVTVHPLGGCPMGETEAEGVTDADCRVYRGDKAGGIYPNLLVCDGSVIPTALGVNPLLTISAIANRAMDRLLEGREVKAPKPVHQIAPPVMGTRPFETETSETYADIAREIDHARYGTIAVRMASYLGHCATTLALEELLKRVFPKNWSPDWKPKIEQFVKLADPSDLRAGFGLIGDVLERLSNGIRRAAPQDARGAFLQTFFTFVGDVAPVMEFRETMRGWVSDQRPPLSRTVVNPHTLAADFGKAANREMVAALRIQTGSLLGWDDRCEVISQIVGASLTGVVTLTGRDGHPQAHDVCDGTFDLLQPDKSQVETWTMIYRCKLRRQGEAEPSWLMEGKKILQNRGGSSYTRDLTTLFVDLTPIGGSAEKEGPQQGIIRLDLQAIAAQIPTIYASYPKGTGLQAWQDALMKAATEQRFATHIKDGHLLRQAFAALLALGNDDAGPLQDNTWPLALHDGLLKFFVGSIGALFGTLVFRTYGGLLAYMKDFPSDSDKTLVALPVPDKTEIRGVTCKVVALPDAVAPQIKLYHFPPPDSTRAAKGPVLLAPGMSTTALSFACLTNGGHSLVDSLLAENYDVWLFDSRLSPKVTPIHHDYTLDDVAKDDWPMAVKHVLRNTLVRFQAGRKPSLQIVAHCVGSLTAQMALLGGHVDRSDVRQMVLMQFTALPAANWFNVIKSEIGVARDFSGGFPDVFQNLVEKALNDPDEWKVIGPIMKNGIPTICPVSAPPDSPAYKVPLDQIHNMIDWNAPFGIDHTCLSPTCHRIYGLYGPVIAHRNLNEDTHNAMRQIFGEIATKPFVQLGLIMQRGRVVTADGKDSYLRGFENLRMPIHIISGDHNQIILTESGYLMQQWLRHKMPQDPHLFTWHVAQGYAHNDCIIGKTAHKDIFPNILDHLKKHADAPH